MNYRNALGQYKSGYLAVDIFLCELYYALCIFHSQLSAFVRLLKAVCIACHVAYIAKDILSTGVHPFFYHLDDLEELEIFSELAFRAGKI